MMRDFDLHARLRELTGFEEQWVTGGGTRSGPVALCHVLLAKCLSEIGSDESEALAAVRELTIADRDRLAWELRRRSFGTRVTSRVECPECGYEWMIDFSAGDLRIEGASAADAAEVPLSNGRTAVLRPVTAADHERFSEMVAVDEADRLQAVLECALESIDGQPPAPLMSSLTDSDRAALAEELIAMNPDKVRLDLSCERCGEPVHAHFDICSFVTAELAAHAESLLEDVHMLARTYHWSEPEVLRLPLRRRLAYLDRIEADHDASLLGLAAEGVH